MTITAPLPTRNEDWGFFGTITMLEDSRADAGEAWPLAFRAIADATKAEPEAVRAFLDSRHGRHFADEVANGLARNLGLAEAIDAATARWMGWRISRRTSRETGIPAGLPYLTGFVLDEGIHAEAADD
jgi:hypothetical protein